MRIAILCLLLSPVSLLAQAAPGLRPFSGLSATSSPWRIEIDSPRPAGVRSEAFAMRAERRFERELPEFHYAARDLGIADRFEAIFFAEKRPIRIGIHLRISGEPLSQQWRQRLQLLFDYLDRDQDRYLNAFEADFLLSNRALEQLLNNGFAYPTAADAGRSLEDLDRDQDRRISFDEFLAYYETTATGLVASRLFVQAQNPANAITRELFKKIDRDGDGKLTKVELDQLPSYLKSLDVDEDECLTLNEILPGFNAFAPAPTEMKSKKEEADTPIEVHLGGRIPQRAAEQLLLRYDRNKDLRLTKEESGFDEKRFKQLDTDQDEQLSLLELLVWREGLADCEVELTLDSDVKKSKVTLRPAAEKDDWKPDFQILEGGKGILSTGNQKLTFSNFVGPPTGRRQQFLNEFNQIYAQADMGGKGFILEKDLVGPSFQLMRLLFDMMDRDADGKVTRKEFDQYAQIQVSFSGLPLLVQYGANTPSLFSVLDVSGDSRLSLRELRDAWATLSKLELPGSTAISRSAIQPQGTIDFGKAMFLEGTVLDRSFSPVVMPAQQGGPIWFNKMDRNNDREVSRTEFLGTREDFDKLDRDRDERISLQEALEFEKQARPPKK